MNTRTILRRTLLTAALFLLLLAACTNPEGPGMGANVTTVQTGTGGATSLAKSADGSRIYIGHITYGGNGALKYYDTATGTIQTIVSGVDVGDFVLDETNNQIIGISNAYSPSFGTFAIDLSGPPYAAVEIKNGTSSFVGGDVMLYNGMVYVLNTTGVGGWPPTGYDNTLYYFPADDFDPVEVVNLGTNQAYSLSRMAVYGSELYYTDTATGQIRKTGLSPTGSVTPSLVTTASNGSAGMIYFSNSKAFVAVGLGAANMGVHTFDPASPPATATHFTNSGAISAQFLAFASASEAFVTHFGGGVYKFNPGDAASSFTIVADTDLSYVDGANGYGLQDIVAASGHLYVAINTWLGDESELMIVDSY